MMIDAVLAVALGLVPVPNSSDAVKIRVAPEQRVKAYTQRVDRSGKTHLGGLDPLSGERFYVTVTKSGKVKGWIGERFVTFHAAPVV